MLAVPFETSWGKIRQIGMLMMKAPGREGSFGSFSGVESFESLPDEWDRADPAAAHDDPGHGDRRGTVPSREPVGGGPGSRGERPNGDHARRLRQKQERLSPDRLEVKRVDAGAPVREPEEVEVLDRQ